MSKSCSRITFILISLVMSIVILSMPAGFAQQPPGLPMIVSGQVTLNGNPAPDGYNITAWDNGAFVGSTLTSGGNFSVQVCGQSGQTCNQGDTISFQLAQLTTSQTTTFSRGFPANLNLDFTGTPNQQPQVVTTPQASVTEAQTTQATTIVTTVSSVTTPEYQDYLTVLLVAMLLALGVTTVMNRNRRT